MAETGSADLHGRFRIRPDIPLGGLSSDGAHAYHAEDGRRDRGDYVAFIVPPGRVLRTAAISQLKILKQPNILTPVDYGVIDWPPLNRRVFAVVFERPAGGRLANNESEPITPWSESDIAYRLILPLIPTFRALALEGLAHRAIRPSNIMFRDPGRRQAMLGDCVCGPPGAGQPAAYETIELGMAEPDGRGPGWLGDDLYALGVLCLHLAFGQLPALGLNPDGLIEDKIRRGSYQALVGDARPPPAILELLRGLLHDDPGERWGTSELALWAEGRRLSPKQLMLPGRAARTLELGGEQCDTVRQAGRAMIRGGEAAIAIARGKGLENWLSRTLHDKTTADAVAIATGDLEERGASGAAADFRMQARVAIALDPAAPIRYRGAATMLDGIGTALATALLAGRDPAAYAELILSRLPQFWCARQPVASPKVVNWVREFDRLQRILGDPRPGYGIERVAYELNPGLHCLSPFVEKSCVDRLPALLPALEAAAEHGIQGLPVDRHIAAFAARRLKNAEESIFSRLGGNNEVDRVLAALRLLARIQAEHGPASVPGLTRLFARHADGVIDRYFNRKLRRRLQGQVDRLAADGDLVELLGTLDDPGMRQEDATQFDQARQAYRAIDARLLDLDTRRRRLQLEAQSAASGTAVVTSAILAAIAVAAALPIVGRL